MGNISNNIILNFTKQTRGKCRKNVILNLIQGLYRFRLGGRNDKKCKNFLTSLPTNLLTSKPAFTLAEVLITLGIIGIVAALTIPGLIAKIQDHHFKVAYKKTYSSLNQAMKFMENDDIGIDLSGFYKTEIGTMKNPVIGEMFKYIATYYYKSPTTCFDKNADKCWVCERGEAGYTKGTAPDWLGCNKESYAFIDANGIAYYLYSNEEYPILIDVNNSRKPNQLGRDRFVLHFANSLEPNNMYSDSVNAILPWYDIVSKQRWCPQGNCLYKSWIHR